MNIIHKLTLRHMKLNQKRTLITILGVIISVAMVTAVSVIVFSLQDVRIRDVISDTGDWHVLYRDVKLSDIAIIENDENTNSFMLSRDIGYAQLEASENPDKPYAFIKAYSEKAMTGMPIQLVAGRFPQAESEIVVPEHLYLGDDAKSEIGTQLTFSIGLRKAGKVLAEDAEYDNEGEILNQTYPYMSGDEVQMPEIFEETGETYTYTVVGVIKQPGFEAEWAPGYTMITYLDTKAMAALDRVNVSVKLNKLSNNIESEALEIAGAMNLDESQFTVNYSLLSAYGYSSSDSFNETFYTLEMILMMIIGIGSVSLIYNAFAISIAERSRHLGMLASIGATKKQKRSSVFFESFVVGCISIPLGLIAGIGGMAVTFYIINPIFQKLMGVSDAIRVIVNLPLVIITVAVSVITLFVSAYIPARRAAKITPIDAIRQTKDVKLKQRSVRTWKIVRKIFGFEGDLALKNLKRHKGRYRATIFSLFISIVLFLTASTYTYYLKKSFDMTQNQASYDASIYNPGERTEEIVSALSQLENLESYSVISRIPESISLGAEQSKPLISTELKEYLKRENGGNYEEILSDWDIMLDIYALDESSMETYLEEIGLDSEEFNDREKNNAILVNRTIVNNGYERADIRPINVAENTVLSLNYSDYQIDDEGETLAVPILSEVELNVAKVTDKVPQMMAFGEYEVYVTVIVSESTLEKMMKDIEDWKNASYSDDTNIYIKSTSPQTLDNDLKELFGEDMDNSLEIYNVYESNIEGGQLLALINVFTYGFIVLITAICVANIFNTISTSVALRKREFAVLKSVGMTPAAFNKMIYFESIFYGMKALLYGLPVSLIIMWLIYDSINGAFYSGFTLPWGSILIAVFSVFIVIGAAMLYSSAKVKRENIVDAIRTETI